MSVTRGIEGNGFLGPELAFAVFGRISPDADGFGKRFRLEDQLFLVWSHEASGFGVANGHFARLAAAEIILVDFSCPTLDVSGKDTISNNSPLADSSISLGNHVDE